MARGSSPPPPTHTRLPPPLLSPLRYGQLFLEAAEYGHAGANFECGVYFAGGVQGVVAPDLAQAAQRYMVAAIGGLAPARFNLALLYERGLGGLRASPERCLQLLDAAAPAHGPAARLLGDRLFAGVARERGKPPERLTEEAVYYWLLAATHVSPPTPVHPRECGVDAGGALMLGGR